MVPKTRPTLEQTVPGPDRLCQRF